MKQVQREGDDTIMAKKCYFCMEGFDHCCTRLAQKPAYLHVCTAFFQLMFDFSSTCSNTRGSNDQLKVNDDS